MIELNISGFCHSQRRDSNLELYRRVVKEAKRVAGLKKSLAFKCLGDSDRTIALMDVISRTAKEGSVGIDLGAGTGILGFAFLNAGGEFVYSVDDSKECISFIEHMAKKLGLEGKIEPVYGDATKFQPRRNVDYVMAELIHTGLQSEPVVEAMSNIHGFANSSAQYLPAGAVSYASFYNTSFSQGRRSLRMSEKMPYDVVDFRTLSKKKLIV